MNKPAEACDLCGLPLRYQQITTKISGKTFRFCCMGCKQVFQMLTEASDSPDPESFRQTELFIKCQEIGIIPRSEAELAERAQELPSATALVSEREHLTALQDENTLTLTLKINQMWCPACAWVIEESLKRSPGIVSASLAMKPLCPAKGWKPKIERRKLSDLLYRHFSP
jgi:NMD protein affecting ribosome stability and mRNA decay